MNSSKNQGRVTIFFVAILCLVFVNLGIFYTIRVTRQTNQDTINVQSNYHPTELDRKTLSTLKDRTDINVEDKLTPYSSGRTNPFLQP